ncbi:unnamed protein product [Rhizophagus irregularis]|uniref:Uncharacterized protein n=1 Tax=Rhizophagus irregularis TaxID=588596 RepID=A0A2I1G0R5_9GLOM|nr:hypothetical protein RhiirA4_453519 [Rhizophagus irregularis]CAB4423533.1 unnamed protein product [Rhizophagus irregularis]
MQKFIVALFFAVLAALMINASPLPDAEPEAHDNPYGSSYSPPSYDPYEKPKPKHKHSGYNTGYEKPTSGYEKPTSDYEKPTSDYEKPSSGYEKPSSGYEKPSSGYEKPSSDYEKPSPYS